MGDIGNKPPVLLVENVILLARKQQVGQRRPDLIRHVGQIERALLPGGSVNQNFRMRNRFHVHGIPPRKAGFLFTGGGNEALERDVFVEGDMADHTGVFSVRCSVFRTADQRSSSETPVRSSARRYSVTRPSKKFVSFLISIISESQGSGFEIGGFSGSRPTPSSLRSPM